MHTNTFAVGTKPNLSGYFKKERLVLKVVGISLTGNEGVAYKIYSFVFILLLIFVYPLLDLREIFINDFDTVAGMLMYEFGEILAIFKTSVVLANRLKLGKILDKFEEEPFKPNLKRGGEKEEKLIKECLWITSVQSIACWIGIFVILGGGILTTLIKRIRSTDYHDWDFPYGPFNILNVTYSPNYEISWFYQNLSLIWIGLHFATTDLVAAGVLAHISYQFKMVQNNFRRVVKNSRDMMMQNQQKHSPNKAINFFDNSDCPNIPWKHLKESFQETVSYHLAVVNIADEIENMYNTLFLLIFLGTLGMLCFLVYRASVLPLNDPRLIRSFIEGITSCMQVGMICYWGNQIVLESEKVGGAVYETDFVGTDLRFQRAIVLVIRRSHNSAKITAGKFANISLTTFAWFLRTSYSAFMVLHKRNENKIQT